MKLKKWLKNILISFLLILIPVCICVLETELIYFYPVVADTEGFRNFVLDNTMLSQLTEKYEWGTQEFYDALTVRMIQTQMNPMKNKKKTIPIRIGPLRPLYSRYKSMYQTLLNDIQCFPVAEDIYGGETVSFDNSWGGKRTYGGQRKHEGCDIMTSNNEAGYFPIVSMTDGIIEKKGWLPLGGWRLGVRSPSGGYFYYAHLDEYAKDVEEGTNIKAGQLLGYMGDSGYGIRGTTGKFDVHLHVGIYLMDKGKEKSVNPYYILKFYEEKKRKFYNKSE